MFRDEFAHHVANVLARTIGGIEHASAFAKTSDKQDEAESRWHTLAEAVADAFQFCFDFFVANFKWHSARNCK